MFFRVTPASFKSWFELPDYKWPEWLHMCHEWPHQCSNTIGRNLLEVCTQVLHKCANVNQYPLFPFSHPPTSMSAQLLHIWPHQNHYIFGSILASLALSVFSQLCKCFSVIQVNLLLSSCTHDTQQICPHQNSMGMDFHHTLKLCQAYAPKF